MSIGTMRRTASFSGCRKYRWSLGRSWGDDPAGPQIGWVLLNPSTADARRDDPTIRRCIRFSQAWGYSRCSICNIFALRSTWPGALYEVRRPIGRNNDAAIRDLTRTCPVIVAAWGVHGALMDRGMAVARLLTEAGAKLFCLGLTNDGHPRHPLYLSKRRRLRVYSV